MDQTHTGDPINQLRNKAVEEKKADSTLIKLSSKVRGTDYKMAQ